MPEHRKKVKKNLQYIPFRPYRHHSGRTISSRMASPSTAVGGKVDLSRQDAQSSPEHTCRDSSGLPKIVQYHSGGATFSGNLLHSMPIIPAQMTRFARFFWLKPPIILFRLCG